MALDVEVSSEYSESLRRCSLGRFCIGCGSSMLPNSSSKNFRTGKLLPPTLFHRIHGEWKRSASVIFEGPKPKEWPTLRKSPCAALRLYPMGSVMSGLIPVASRNVAPTDNALQKRCVSAAENDGSTRSYLLAPFRATPFGHSRHALAGRCF